MTFNQRQHNRRATHEQKRKHLRQIIKKEVNSSYFKMDKQSRFAGLKNMLRNIMTQGRREMIQEKVKKVEAKRKGTNNEGS